MASSSNRRTRKSDPELEEFPFIAGVVADYVHRNLQRRPSHNRPFTGWDNLQNLLGNENERRCYENLRMRPYVFSMLCDTLREEYGLRATAKITVQEKVATFLMTVGIGQGNRQLQEFFQRGGSTISNNICEVLQACVHMSRDWIRRFDDPTTLHPRIASDTRYFPFFKDCIGALDGTHIPAKLPEKEKIPFIGRKGEPTQNILAICDFDLYFTYVVPGWEGSAHDARILSDAINDPRKAFPVPPPGKYYLVDAGYSNAVGFMSPYKGERYHLPDFQRARTYNNEHEKFNHMHSSLRSAIERSFGIWKAKFQILNKMPGGFDFQKQSEFVAATMALHNFIRRKDYEDRDFSEHNVDPGTSHGLSNDAGPSGARGDQTMNNLRDHICRQISSARNRV